MTKVVKLERNCLDELVQVVEDMSETHFQKDVIQKHKNHYSVHVMERSKNGIADR